MLVWSRGVGAGLQSLIVCLAVVWCKNRRGCVCIRTGSADRTTTYAKTDGENESEEK